MEKVEIFLLPSSQHSVETLEVFTSNILKDADKVPGFDDSPNGPYKTCKIKIWYIDLESGVAETFNTDVSFTNVLKSLRKGKVNPIFSPISCAFKKILTTLNHPGKTVVNIHVWKWQNERDNRGLTDSLSSLIQIYCAKITFYSEDFQVYLIPPEVPASVVILPVDIYEGQSPAWRGQVAIFAQNTQNYEFVKYLEMFPWPDDTGLCSGMIKKEEASFYYGDKLELINQCDFRSIPANMFSGKVYSLSSSCDVRGRHAEDARDFFSLANAESNKSFVFRLIYSLDLPLAWKDNRQELRSIGRIRRYLSFASYPLPENSNRRLLLFLLKNVEDSDDEVEVKVEEMTEEKSIFDQLPSIPMRAVIELTQLKTSIGSSHVPLMLNVLKTRSKDFHVMNSHKEEEYQGSLLRTSWPSSDVLDKRNKQLSQLYTLSHQGDSRVFSISTAEAVRIFKDANSSVLAKLRPRRRVRPSVSDEIAASTKWIDAYSGKIKSLGICYNIDKDSELKEAECWKIHEKVAGRETESSCNPLDSGYGCFILRRTQESQNVESVSNLVYQKQVSSDADKKSLTRQQSASSPLPLRRSPRKRKHSGETVAPGVQQNFPASESRQLTKAERNHQLREDFSRVIYKCLKGRGIGTKDRLYQVCGTKLYSLLKNYARLHKDADMSSHKLLEVCEKHIEGVIEECRNEIKIK
ncbi:uncharacterized protein LOC136027921 [Artemia franciscana]|uniref:Mdm2-binding protein n=1 Tax=Artemia franciscana TaxID=6661 RepID=A0AA88KZY0_ARTSF|nr:hypothetical protein QYM36_014180 [Artemia franciscana]KAK2708480.1 hypothetical protein QYM36_014180 [Artemia franciscana]